jgi:hypothetical protein
MRRYGVRPSTNTRSMSSRWLDPQMVQRRGITRPAWEPGGGPDQHRTLEHDRLGDDP